MECAGGLDGEECEYSAAVSRCERCKRRRDSQVNSVSKSAGGSGGGERA